MAPWGGALTDAQIRDVVAFVRSLAKPPYKK
jgi:mono/diheme cytochrome c family protein